jgi:TonB family protein
VPLIDLPETIDLAFDEIELPDDGRHEPIFVAAPSRSEIAQPVRLDPKRIEFGPEPPPPSRGFWRGPIGSLLLHLLPLLVLIGWSSTPFDAQPPIPVQLLIEQPPPPAPAPAPPAQPKPPASPPAGMRASDDFGAVAGDKIDTNKGEAPPAQGAPPAAEPAPAQAVPDPNPAKEQLAIAPVPAPAETQTMAPPPQPPKPIPPKHQAAMSLPKPDGQSWPLPLNGPSREPQHVARLVGPNASRDEYCAYALSLVMTHIDLLPLSLLGARHGDTSVTMRVLSDGTIASVRIIRGSGYSDIDERVEQMVVAVGRLPPLPQWIPGPATDLTFHLHFPHPAEH